MLCDFFLGLLGYNLGLVEVRVKMHIPHVDFPNLRGKVPLATISCDSVKAIDYGGIYYYALSLGRKCDDALERVDFFSMYNFVRMMVA